MAIPLRGNNVQLKDKIIVVTGASKGFGKALATAFQTVGARVVITSTNEAELHSAAEELSVDCFVADASSSEATQSLADYVIGKYGQIDIWVNNAGIQIAPSNLEVVDLGRLHDLFNLNFFGYFYGCAAALKDMKQRNSGMIININSTAGLSGKPGLSAYVSSKFAIKGMTESIRTELNDTDIQVMQIFPGGMQTDIYKEKVPADIDDYMSVDYAIDKVMSNLKLETPEQDLIIKRPTVA